MQLFPCKTGVVRVLYHRVWLGLACRRGPRQLKISFDLRLQVRHVCVFIDGCALWGTCAHPPVPTPWYPHPVLHPILCLPPILCCPQFALYDRIAKKVGVVSGLSLDQFVTGVKETEDLDFVLWLSRMFPGRGRPTHSLLPITDHA